MMVENIPFMHIICNLAIKAQGMGESTFATVLYAYSISSLIVGISFFLLGYFKLGNVVYFFPRYCIIGCIGGMGVFLYKTGMEVSVDQTLTLSTALSFLSPAMFYLWIAPSILEILLRVFLYLKPSPLLPPFFFISVPPLFYTLLFIAGVPISVAREGGWFFEATESADCTLLWRLMDLGQVDWLVVLNAVPTVIALTIFRYTTLCAREHQSVSQ